MKVIGLDIYEKFDLKEMNNLFELVSKERREKINRFKNIEDTSRSIFSEILTRKVISKELNLPFSSVFFNYSDHGKPFIDSKLKFHFNLSHSGNWIVCVIDNKPVGIDIEKISPIDYTIAKKYFTNEEYEDLISKEENHQLSYFYDLWTLKESYIKCIGLGLSYPLNFFTIKKNENRIIFKTDKTRGEFYFQQYDISSNYKLSVCSQQNKFPGNFEIMELRDLYFL